MFTRRHLLALASGAGVGLLPGFAPFALAAPKSALGKPVGLELYSLRHLLDKDVPGTLALVKKMGFDDVEVPGLYGKTADEFAGLLKKAGLTARSYIAGYDALDKRIDGVIKEARALGVKHVVCAWIPHKGKLSADDVKRTAEAFGKWGKTLASAGLRFAYHIHGYEFEPAPDGNGTLMDTLITTTPAEHVDIELDVFWVVRGSGDPVKMLEKYGKRVTLLHLKDIAKGVDTSKPDGGAPDDTSVVLGTGQIDWVKVLRAAKKANVRYHFIEDEHPEAEKQIPQTLAYLKALKL